MSLRYPLLFCFLLQLLCGCLSTRTLDERVGLAGPSLHVTNGDSADVIFMPGSKRPLVIGHRGSAGTKPENTLTAMKEGAASGADRVEMDLQLTSDLVLVLSHDPDLSALHCRDPSGVPVNPSVLVSSLTAAQVATYDCGAPPVKEAPPTFDSILTWQSTQAPSTLMVIHLKEGHDTQTYTSAVMNLIAAHNSIPAVLVMSFEADLVQASAALQPGLYTGLFLQNQTSFCDLAKAAGVQVAAPFYTDVTASEVQHCHDLGLTVYSWTANAPADWAHLVAASIDGIITDFPRNLENWLGPP